MRVKSRCGFFTVAVLSLSLSHLPNVVLAETIQAQKKMISTSEVLENFDRKLAQEKVANFLSQKDVELKLVEQGLSLAEAKARVMSLSDQELQNLSTQVDKAQYGGDILVTILLIVLIIFLIKRI
ncbi:PA2779 family protein [Pseudobdellovibrio sp. HCB154]|uniref:PA2779 family protein n=1 Tax=Pseudobdellovibrio sp. HCB154 TaxID=3386277 RepID=UPI003917055B